jgi:hypothetical protein
MINGNARFAYFNKIWGIPDAAVSFDVSVGDTVGDALVIQCFDQPVEQGRGVAARNCGSDLGSAHVGADFTHQVTRAGDVTREMDDPDRMLQRT